MSCLVFGLSAHAYISVCDLRLIFLTSWKKKDMFIPSESAECLEVFNQHYLLTPIFIKMHPNHGDFTSPTWNLAPFTVRVCSSALLTRWRRFDFAKTHISHRPKPVYTGTSPEPVKPCCTCIVPHQRGVWTHLKWTVTAPNRSVSIPRQTMS